MKIKSIKIKSNVIGYGPRPLCNDEVEQYLTITSAGEVCCKRFAYGNGEEEYLLKDEKRVNISEEAASRILACIDKLINAYEPIWATDVGEWYLEALFDDGSKESIHGSIIGTEPVNGVDLSELIREEIPIEGLFVFDGGVYEDEE